MEHWLYSSSVFCVFLIYFLHVIKANREITARNNKRHYPHMKQPFINAFGHEHEAAMMQAGKQINCFESYQ